VTFGADCCRHLLCRILCRPFRCSDLNLTTATFARERRSGRLKFQKKGHRVFYLGQWLLDWMNAETVKEQVHAVA